MIYIIIVVLTLYLILSYKKINWAFFVLLTSLPLYVIRFNILGLPSTLLEGMILILFFTWVSKNYKNIIESIKERHNSSFVPLFFLSSKRDPAKAVIIDNSKLTRYPFDIEITLVLIVAFIAMGVSHFNNGSMGIWKAYFFEALLVYLLAYNIVLRSNIRNEQLDYFSFFKKIILPLSISAFYISVIAIYQKITGNFIPNELWAAVETRRVTAVFGYPNAIALYLAPIFILSFGFLLALKQKYQAEVCGRDKCENWTLFSLEWFKVMSGSDKWLFSFVKLSALLSLLSIYFARSEGALIAIAISLLIAAMFLKPFKEKSYLRRSVIALGLLSITIIMSIAPLRSIFINRIELNDFSGQIRKAQWSETAIMLRDGAWLMGAGLDNYQNKIAPYHKDGIYLYSDNPDHEELIEFDPEYQKQYWQPLEIFMYPHNIFLNFWVELGLFGLLLFVYIIFKFIYLCLSFLQSEINKVDRFLLLSLLVTMMVIVIHGIVDVPYFKNDLAVLFWIVFALLGAFILKTRRDVHKNS